MASLYYNACSCNLPELIKRLVMHFFASGIKMNKDYQSASETATGLQD